MASYKVSLPSVYNKIKVNRQIDKLLIEALILVCKERVKWTRHDFEGVF